MNVIAIYCFHMTTQMQVFSRILYEYEVKIPNRLYVVVLL